jgi:outer membrane protein OmpA-like peptidoglycan-associated protein
MKNINYLKFIKILSIFFIIMGSCVACAVRLGPTFVTSLALAKLPEPSSIIATPLGSNAQKIKKIKSQGRQTERNLRFILDTVLFETGKANLLPEGKQIVEEFVQSIQQQTSPTILIEGHTDNRGSKKYNLRLSKRRIKTVQETLIAQGVNPERWVLKDFGENNPVTTNATNDGRQQNRRVEIILLNKEIIP